jgi:hypothetical protein
MALLRQCLSELRLRRGEAGLDPEGSHDLAGEVRIAGSMRVAHRDGGNADRSSARTDISAVPLCRPLVLESAWNQTC